MPRSPSHGRAPHDAAAERRLGGQPGVVQRPHLVGDRARARCRRRRRCRRRPARRPRSAARTTAPDGRVQPRACAGVGRELLLPRRGEAGEVRDVDQRRDDGGAARGHVGDEVLGQAGAVLDGVDAGRDQAGQRVGAERVRGDPGALLVRGGDRRGQGVGGPLGREVADAAVDPVADQLHPAVAAAGLHPHLVGQVGRLDLDAEVAHVAARRGDVPAGPDDPRQVGLVVERSGCRPASRSRAAPARRRRGRSAPARALRRGPRRALPPGAIPTWQWASTSPGTSQPPRLTVSAPGDRLEREPAVAHPDVAVLALGQHHAREVQRRRVTGRAARP